MVFVVHPSVVFFDHGHINNIQSLTHHYTFPHEKKGGYMEY